MPCGSGRSRQAAAWLAGVTVLLAGNVDSSAAAASSTAFLHLGQRTGARGLAAPASSSTSASSLRMRVEVDVKDSVGGPAPSTPRGSGRKGPELSVPPPVRTDNFKHKSGAGVSKDCGPYMNVGRLKLNTFGAWFALVSLLLAMPWALALAVLYPIINIIEKVDPCRTVVDIPYRLYFRAFVNLGFSHPEITGLENMPEGPVVFVANHASWMFVPYASLLPHYAKYFAKADLGKVPVLGWAMLLAKHVMVDRNDKRSQIESPVRAREILKSGVPLFLFPEGTRGKDGRLGEFKGGAFRLAVKCGVPIVPISMAGTHLSWPPSVLMPQRPGQGITAVHVHPAVCSKGRSEKELAQIAFDIINDALPPEQKCLPPAAAGDDDPKSEGQQPQQLP